MSSFGSNYQLRFILNVLIICSVCQILFFVMSIWLLHRGIESTRVNWDLNELDEEDDEDHTESRKTKSWSLDTLHSHRGTPLRNKQFSVPNIPY